jgi:hypothetical protein
MPLDLDTQAERTLGNKDNPWRQTKLEFLRDP